MQLRQLSARCPTGPNADPSVREHQMTAPQTHSKDNPALEPALARRLSVGLGLIMLLGATVAGWAANSQLSGAVIASGVVVIDTSVKKVQHQQGGIVGAIMVKTGDHVKAGDVVIRLDDTQARANLGIITSQIVQLTGRKARLVAERDNAATISFPGTYAASDPEASTVAEGETRLFEKRRTALEGQKLQLKERVGQLEREIEGLTAQAAAKDEELKLMKDELGRVVSLRNKELVPVQRLLSTQRDHTRLEGERGVLTAQIAKARGSISETQLQIFGLDQSTQSEANKELREIEARIAELAERRTGADDMLKRIELRAPQSGLIHELAVHTVGGVIAPGETIMSIVPKDDDFAIEVKISPIDIDQVAIGLPATLRFSAFNQTTTPELKGYVVQRAEELTKEAQTGNTYYMARLRIADSDREKASKMRLVSGMPVEGFIETSQRTALSYLMKPITDQFNRAFREE